MDRNEMQRYVEEEAKRRGIRPELARSILMQESGGNPNAPPRQEPRLGTASYGPMQVLATTARGMGFKGSTSELAKPDVNIQLGLDYLSQRREQGQKLGLSGPELERWSVAAYNAGTPHQNKMGQFLNQGYVDAVYGRMGENQMADNWSGAYPPDIQSLMSSMQALGMDQEKAASPYKETADQIRAQIPGAKADVDAAARGLDPAAVDETLQNSLRRTPLMGPKLPVPEERSVGNRFLTSLASNMATAISGNQMYQAANVEQMEKERAERQTAIQSNALMDRQETLNRRDEILKTQIDRYQRAQDYYTKSQDLVRANEFAGKEAKVQAEREQLNDTRGALKDWGDEYIRGQMDMNKTLAALGLRMGTNGQPEVIPGAKIKGIAELSDKFMKPDEAEKLIGERLTSLSNFDPKWADTGRGKEAYNRIVFDYMRLHAMPRTTDNAETLWQRIADMPGPPGQMIAKEGTPEAAALMASKRAIYEGMLLAYAGVLPGAAERYQEIITGVAVDQAKSAAASAESKLGATEPGTHPKPPQAEYAPTPSRGRETAGGKF